jgi:adenylate cyclase
VAEYTREEAAGRSGVTVDFVDGMASVGLVGGSDSELYSDADVRRLQILSHLERAGLPLDGLGVVVSQGHLTLDFIETAGQDVFAPLEPVTFAEMSADTGIPIEVLSTIREAMGGPPASGDDRVGRLEMEVLPLVQMQDELGFRHRAIQQGLRVYGETLSRVAETEAEWFRTEILEPTMAKGLSQADLARIAVDLSPRLSAVSDPALMAIYHAQQGRAWMANIINGLAGALEAAGLHTVEQSIPAMCFLDITGYTSLAAQEGDQVAADTAETLRRIVDRRAAEHDGRAVKWLGDGVMLWFPSPGPGVMATVEMVDEIAKSGLPPAHVGLHAGPVVFQEGDYYGNTVNVAARIGEYARPGEVLVSQEVVDRAEIGRAINFEEIGSVELRGLSEPITLYAVVAT